MIPTIRKIRRLLIQLKEKFLCRLFMRWINDVFKSNSDFFLVHWEVSGNQRRMNNEWIDQWRKEAKNDWKNEWMKKWMNEWMNE